MKILVLLSSVATIILLIIATLNETVTVKWKGYQKAYRKELLSRAKTDRDRKTAKITINLQQIYLPALNRTDRCVTCHIGIENPKMAKAEQPIKAHSGNIFKHHPLNKFGCTVCHDGQSYATETSAAHGEVEFWPQPLLRGNLVYTSCGRSEEHTSELQSR